MDSLGLLQEDKLDQQKSAQANSDDEKPTEFYHDQPFWKLKDDKISLYWFIERYLSVTLFLCFRLDRCVSPRAVFHILWHPVSHSWLHQQAGVRSAHHEKQQLAESSAVSRFCFSGSCVSMIQHYDSKWLTDDLFVTTRPLQPLCPCTGAEGNQIVSPLLSFWDSDRNPTLLYGALTGWGPSPIF